MVPQHVTEASYPTKIKGMQTSIKIEFKYWLMSLIGSKDFFSMLQHTMKSSQSYLLILYIYPHSFSHSWFCFRFFKYSFCLPLQLSQNAPPMTKDSRKKAWITCTIYCAVPVADFLAESKALNQPASTASVATVYGLTFISLWLATGNGGRCFEARNGMGIHSKNAKDVCRKKEQFLTDRFGKNSQEPGSI